MLRFTEALGLNRYTLYMQDYGGPVGFRMALAHPSIADVMQQIDHAARHVLATQPQSLKQLQDARVFFEVGMVRRSAPQCR